MRGRVSEPARARDGTYTVTITGLPPESMESFDRLKDGDADVIIKPFRRKRSLDANRFCWALIDRIAEVSGETRSAVYRKAILDIPGVSDIVCCIDRAVPALRAGWESRGLGWQTDTLRSQIDGCTNVVLYYGSSMYDTAQMSRLIDSLIQEAESLGIPTIDDTERKKLLKSVEKREEN